MDQLSQQLIPQRRLVALEAFATTDMQSLIQRVLPSIMSSLGGFRGSFGQAPAVGITSDQNRFLKTVVEKRNYATLEPLVAYVPEGLKVPYLEYAQVLHNAVEQALMVPNALNEFTVYLAQLVSNKMALQSTVTNANKHKVMEAMRQRVAKEVQGCFDGSTRSETKVENVIKRNADWKPLFEACGNISAGINSIERSLLQKKVTEASELLDRISDMVKRGEFENAAPQVLLALSEGAYQVASALEFYSIIYYNAQAFTHAVQRTLERITKVMESDDKKLAA